MSEKRKFLNSAHYNRTLDVELSITENALINFNIYSHPDHVQYYSNYHMSNFEFCYNYLMKNRHLLTLEHTPADKLEIAKVVIENAKEFYSDKN